MNTKDELGSIAAKISGNLNEKRAVFEINSTIAERKAFLSVKKLIYYSKIKVDDANKELHFFEMLKEAGAGLSSGFDSETSSNFGFKKEVYKTGVQGRVGSIEEQSKLFGKDYTYKFDYAQVRNVVKALAENLGYKFSYHLLPNF
jgi:hypothetical protein